MAEKLFEDVEEIVNKLLAGRNIPVESIRFFGSRTQNAALPDSDVDMLIVSSAFEGKDIFKRAEMTKGVHRALVKRFNLPFDIVYCSITEWQTSSSLLLEEIKRVA
jgi:predicted nucleotidyltransferase